MDLNSAESLHDIELLISQLDRQLGKTPIKSPSTPAIKAAGKQERSMQRVEADRKVEDRLRQAGVVYTRKRTEQLYSPHRLKSGTETNVKAAEKPLPVRPETTRHTGLRTEKSRPAETVKTHNFPLRSKSPTEAKHVTVSLLSPNRSQSVSAHGGGSKNSTSASTATVKVHREGEITERMLRYQKIYEEKRKELQSQQARELTFTPKINTQSRAPSPLRTKSPLLEAQPAFTPQLSKHSLRLAARLGSSTERLRTPTPRRTPRPLDDNCTFAPAVDPNSVRLDRRQKVGEDGRKVERWEGLFELVQVFKEKREELNRKYARMEEEEEAACTFHPQVSSPSNSLNPKQLPTRLVNWAKDKSERLRLQRDAELAKETEKCTFRPEVHSVREEGASPLRMSKGLDKFLERQEIARRLKVEKELQQCKYTGQNWTPKLTQPASPKFHCRTGTPTRRTPRVPYLDLNL